MKVRSAESEGTQSSATRNIPDDVPWPQFGIYIKRRVGKVDARVRMIAVHARRQLFVMQCQNRLQEPGCPGCTLQVSDVGLHRPECDRMLRQIIAAERMDHALDFDH